MMFKLCSGILKRLFLFTLNLKLTVFLCSLFSNECRGMESQTNVEFVRPDLPSRCTWHINADPSLSPHTKKNP